MKVVLVVALTWLCVGCHRVRCDIVPVAFIDYAYDGDRTRYVVAVRTITLQRCQ